VLRVNWLCSHAPVPALDLLRMTLPNGADASSMTSTRDMPSLNVAVDQPDW
jgi:hypothetical protein